MLLHQLEATVKCLQAFLMILLPAPAYQTVTYKRFVEHKTVIQFHKWREPNFNFTQSYECVYIFLYFIDNGSVAAVVPQQ